MFGCRFTMRSRIIISNFLVLLLISSPTTGLQAAQTERLMIVTGASAGIGEAIVKKFSKDGWKVAALARNKDKLLSVAKDAGDRCVPIVCDVSIPQSDLALPSSDDMPSLGLPSQKDVSSTHAIFSKTLR